MAATGTSHRHDDYWKLELYTGTRAKDLRDLLNARGYHAGSSASIAALRDAFCRFQLGHVSYTGLGNSALRAFIGARSIDARSFQRADMLQALRYADDNPRFRKFLKLPPELRNRIYEYHFAAFRQPIYASSQPPIARASSVIRQESLPIFYGVCAFDIPFLGPRNTTGRIHRPTTVLKLPSGSRNFLDSTPDRLLARVTKLKLRIMHHSFSSWERLTKTLQVSPVIAMTKVNGVWIINFESDKDRDHTHIYPDDDKLESLIQKHVGEKGYHGKAKALSKDGVYDLRWAIEEALAEFFT